MVRIRPEWNPYGLVVYRSRTVFEDATPDMVRDFFWDDEFRPKWDPMLVYFKMLEECPHTGTTIVHWIKKVPLFLQWHVEVKPVNFLGSGLILLLQSRKYRILTVKLRGGKRLLIETHPINLEGVPYPALQRRDKPRRVDLYFSSWVIKPEYIVWKLLVVQSRRGDGLSACEVILMHYEDMGIPKDVAKLGVRHGMWGTVKKLHSGFRAYQQARKSDAPLSRCALMARITTKISSDENVDASEPRAHEEEKDLALDIPRGADHGGVDWKWIVLGGTVALVCGLHTGAIGKALLLGAGQRIARR
ncbi:polyketide cyclase/dehydrase and lipid transport superfamily protein [Actinidia rufa]|uniref:Polyketide cyclase/dehydrase and lipid transport superfamily protein n=1 Tax=Actinidia rufa TaxID=165716 RepID=A0A7J0EES2_9ERIC|nr:polyketide cyclase/dehydrase and lipid transport superfamily protein [Actinidia rufa]